MSRLKNAPDFLGVGMQKAGTSWLYEQLRNHPDAWLPKRKELHFFDALSKDDWNTRRQRRALKNIPELTSKLAETSAQDRDLLIEELEENLHFARTINDLDWYRNFWEKVSDQNKLIGEITPAYSILSRETIRLIHDDLGVQKIVLILRNPVERSWSQYKMMTERKSNDPETVYMKDKLVDRGRAKTILENWESIFDPDQIFIGFYDDIKLRPHWFLEELCGFLGLSFSKELFPKAETPVRVSRNEECPKHILEYFKSEYQTDLDYLANRFQGHALGWKAQYS
jgi:hypothetical protein